MLIVISYDLPNDRRRTRLANALEDFGVRVQYSVFECLLTPDQIERFRARMASLLDPAEDSVRIYRLCQDCVEKIEILGQGKVTEDTGVYVV